MNNRFLPPYPFDYGSLGFAVNPFDMRPASKEDLARLNWGAQQCSEEDYLAGMQMAAQWRAPPPVVPQGWADWFAIGDLIP